jgi:hypothetical protein
MRKSRRGFSERRNLGNRGRDDAAVASEPMMSPTVTGQRCPLLAGTDKP